MRRGTVAGARWAPCLPASLPPCLPASLPPCLSIYLSSRGREASHCPPQRCDTAAGARAALPPTTHPPARTRASAAAHLQINREFPAVGLDSPAVLSEEQCCHRRGANGWERRTWQKHLMPLPLQKCVSHRIGDAYVPHCGTAARRARCGRRRVRTRAPRAAFDSFVRAFAHACIVAVHRHALHLWSRPQGAPEGGAVTTSHGSVSQRRATSKRVMCK
eukprot:COSAG02_NODE_4241_length_5596_cov_4.207932_6_plen_218_part_00